MNNRILTIALALVFLIPTVVLSQSKDDVIISYNKALELGGDTTVTSIEAYNAFKKTIEMAEALGAEAVDIKEKAEKQLSKLMYKHALALYKSKKITEALASFKEAEVLGRKFGDEAIASKSVNNQVILYNALGKQEVQKQNFDNALEFYNKALEINANYDVAAFNIAKILKDQDKRDESITMLDKARQIGERIKSPSVTRKAERIAAEYLIFWGATAIEQQKYSAADEYLNKALIYDIESSDAYYRLAELSNKQGQYAEAVDFAEQALDFEKGSNAEKAKIYYELGLAQQSMGNKDKACSAFKSASFGRFKASAEYKIEQELKCDGAK